MKTFTFDTNCIIDIADQRPPAAFVNAIIEAHRDGRAKAAFVAVSASERQRSDYYLPTFEIFQERLRKLEIDDIPYICGLGYYEISYWDHAIFSSEVAILREREIHDILFPNIGFVLADFARAKGIDGLRWDSKHARKWRNAWCDRQMIWAHDNAARDIFVTSDRNFQKLNGKPNFSNIKVCTPEEASILLL